MASKTETAVVIGLILVSYLVVFFTTSEILSRIIN